MKIDRNNYELYFFDYFEGNLNQKEKEALLRFLDDHPDLKSEFDEFEQHDSDVPEGAFQFKNTLKKDISDLGEVDEDSIDEYSIAYLENDLDENEKTALLDAVKQNSEFEKTFKLYQLTKLKPDLRLYYRYKKQLKHVVLNRKAVLRTIGYAAAAAVLILGVFMLNPAEDVQPEQQIITEINEEKEPVEIVKNQETKTVEKPDAGPIRKTKQPEAEESHRTQTASNSKTDNRIPDDMQKLTTKPVHSLDNRWQQDIVMADLPVTSNEMVEQKVEQELETIADLQPENKASSSGKGGINLMSIAQIGVKVFSKLNERNIELEPEYSNSGELKSVTVITEQRKITTPAI